jgi:cytochrome c oxidase assembly factor CtaG
MWAAQTGPLDLLVQVLLAVTGASYLWGVRRLGRVGRLWPVARSAAFAGGLLSIWVAVGSGLARHDDTNVTVHVAQHLLLMMVAPPLLVLGRPILVAVQAARRPGQVRITHLLHSRTVRVAGHPVLAWAVYLASMYAMLANRPVYGFLVDHPLCHDAGHAGLVLAGLLYWEPLLGGGLARRMGPPSRVVSVLANMPFEVLVGLWLRYQTRPIDRLNTVADTQRAGEVFIVGATALSTLWLAVIVTQLGAAAWREERRAALDPGPAVWSTPWWAAERAAVGPPRAVGKHPLRSRRADL